MSNTQRRSHRRTSSVPWYSPHDDEVKNAAPNLVIPRRPEDPMDAARPRHSPPADRFLDLFSSPSPSLATPPSAGDELLEGDLLFPAPSSDPPPDASRNPGRVPHGRLGLLAALHDGDRKLLARGSGGGSGAAAVAAASASATASAATAGTLLRRKATIAAAAAAAASSSPTPSVSATRAIPRPRIAEQTPMAPYHQSAPMMVPVRPPRRRDAEDDDDEELFPGGAAMLPPHEMVARASAGGPPVNPSSMLEGVGRTLKGRDLRRVRDAVLRQTGFLD
ncbi:homeobox protein Nkx-6.1 [Brachypodium distachyon]|uniref:Senescence regulator n=1 Tax=Brachypodium distachyon TaxID=15368 RepID=A0A0Q3REF4_BRADI|nr:homeobox protein Nkx-6.1 [Brachypodium distachyon]KQK11578.1 hypothetical protein BRADI_2g60960v3 [Brachypodium distachyon]|eukprot:XP_003565087.2 homeobox protein Nkx-6.1 [Brachypodium distachyon]